MGRCGVSGVTCSRCSRKGCLTRSRFGATFRARARTRVLHFGLGGDLGDSVQKQGKEPPLKWPESGVPGTACALFAWPGSLQKLLLCWSGVQRKGRGGRARGWGALLPLGAIPGALLEAGLGQAGVYRRFLQQMALGRCQVMVHPKERAPQSTRFRGKLVEAGLSLQSRSRVRSTGVQF